MQLKLPRVNCMALVCPHCGRINAPHARFCYYDGASLLANAAPIETARKTFLAPFVFPSGFSCNTYDEFAEGCQSHWDTAVEMLHQGTLKTFFSGLGRLDLAAAAQEAAAFPDRERALDLFLSRLPTTRFSLPKLDVQPKLINLGTLAIGHVAQFDLHLENQGDRLIFGSITTNVPWLSVTANAPPESEARNAARLFQFRDGATIPIQVKGQHFRAQLKPLEGTITIESNAGTFKLKVIAAVPILPFPEGVLAGARSPRELAEKAKATPRQAAPLFESGAVAAWYQSNGWIYPVQGASFSGLAAIQQFFEALGMSRPPKVQINVPRLELSAAAGTRVTCKLEVHTDENRAVYAHAVSPVSWIVAKPGILLGTSVTLPFEISTPPNAGETYETIVRVFANGAQRFDVPVQMTAVKVANHAPPIAPLPATTVAAAQDSKADVLSDPNEITRASSAAASNTLPERVHRAPFNYLHFAPVAVLLLVICGLIGIDAILDEPMHAQAQVMEEAQEEPSNLRMAEVQYKVAIQDEPDDDPPIAPVVRFKIDDEPEEVFAKQPLPPVKVEIKDEPGENQQAIDVPITPNPLVSYTYHTTPRTFGISGTAAAGSAANKQLTYASNGSTNSTMVSVDGARGEFGASQGQWTRSRQPIDKFAATPGAAQPSHSTWVWNGIKFHQILEVVPGQAVTIGGNTRRQLDSVLVRWIMENNSKIAKSAGMRMQLDTLIGRNDGVPFTIPGRTGLVSTFADFRAAKDVPDFLQALERPNLRDPGTVAHLTLKPGGGIEAPGRVSLTLWPPAGSATLLTYDVPVVHMQNDSAVVMYWPEKSLKPGETRTVGFAYGLGNVSTNDKLGLTLGGSFEPGQNFTVTAYVENPIAGQTLKLELPDGLRRAEGAETQTVAMAPGGRNTSVVTWKVLVERTGVFRLKVNSSTGISQAKTIAIAQGAAPTGGKLSVELQGSFEPGQAFTVVGKVTEPVEGQTLTLHLPAGLQKIEGETTQRLNGREATASWKVKVLEPGKYPVRVASSTGIAQTKTITIVQPGRAEGAFQILLTGDFAPGKAFTVSTKVANPAPEQKLTLVLPAGLEREEGNETRNVLANEPIAWKVKVREPGKFLVGVRSTTGVMQRKTVIIEPPGDAPGRFTVEFEGDIRPGREFLVKADVRMPAANQTLTLALPKGLQLTEGAATQNVTANSATWKVRVVESGRLPIRVESSTGHVRSKTITLSESTSTLFGR